MNDDEVARFVDLFDRDRRDFGRFWNDNGIWQTQNCPSLLSAPAFDRDYSPPKHVGPNTNLQDLC